MFLAIVLAGLPLVQPLYLSILRPESLAILTTRAVNTLACHDGKGYRTLWQIVWSCLSTLFLCTWVSIHPNIPGMHEHWAKILLRRLGIMSALLIAPELMVAWAMRQRILARRLAKEHERDGWTDTHGFFAIMGGFMAFEDDQEVQVLLPEELKGYSLSGTGEFPTITAEEIRDKSKHDIIAKGLLMLQVGWFVSQCISRLVQGQPIAEIELVTIAFAVISIAMFFLWWNKPFDVQQGIRVYYKKSNTLPAASEIHPIPISTKRISENKLRKDQSLTEQESRELGRSTPSFGSRFMRFMLAPITLLVGLAVGGQPDIIEEEGRISTFYPETSSVDSERYIVLSGVIAATVFGAIHCVAWRFRFPTHTEQFIWRFSSVIITGGPSTFVLLVWLWTKSPKIIFAPPLVAFMGLYMVCRIFLLILPFLLLRSLPPNTYNSVPWLGFIPHL